MLKVAYGSVYGHAQNYAQSFAESFGLTAQPYKELGPLNGRDSIVYFGALYAGGVKGLTSLKGTAKWFILVTVGLANPKDPENIKSIHRSIEASRQKLDFEISKIFLLRGGIDYSHLRIHHKVLMKFLYLKIKKIPVEKQSEEVKTMIQTYGSQVNFLDLATLDPVIDYVKGQES